MENLRSYITDSTEVLKFNIMDERNTNLDLTLSKMGYYMELSNTKSTIERFTSTLLDYIAILAVGGHRKILDVMGDIEREDLFDYINSQENPDPLVNDLYNLYKEVMLTYTGLASIVDKQRSNHNFDIDNLYSIMKKVK